MILDVLLLVVGLVLIIKGGDLFVASSVRIATILDVPRVVIGTTLVSLATTSPELVVSLVAGMKGESGLAVGNAVGSCMANMCLILGVMAVIRAIGVHPSELRIPLIAMFAFTLILLVLSWNLVLPRSTGIALVVLGVGYFVFDFLHHRHAPKPEELAEAISIEDEITADNKWLETGRGAALVFFVGAVMVIFGSRFLVDSASSIARGMGVPPIIIGLTIVAVGTSLPELVTAISSARQDVSDLAVGNILGANVANLTLIVGSAATLNDVTMTRITQLLNFPALLVGMLMVLWMLCSERKISKREGAILIGYYVLYVTVVLLSPSFNR